MTILFDVGNTSITYGFYEGGRLTQFGSFLENDIPKYITKWIKSGVFYNSEVIISSVVPKISHRLKKSLIKEKGCGVWFAGGNLPIPIKHRYASIDKLGIDRAVNIYGALRIYTPPVLIFDYGTAITADYVSGKGVFEGGMIIPGPEISFHALIEKAALLPKKLRLPEKRKAFLGKTTYDCMSAGILEGYGALTDGLISRFKDRYGKKMRVLLTGGFCLHLKPFIHHDVILDLKHSIKSLLLVFKDFRKQQ